jgi:hypothetical protein
MQRRCVTKVKTFKLRFLRDELLDFYAVLDLSDMRNTLMDMSIHGRIQTWLVRIKLRWL